MELVNLYGNPAVSEQLATLVKELNVQNVAKRREPVGQPWADGSAVQFPFDATVPVPQS